MLLIFSLIKIKVKKVKRLRRKKQKQNKKGLANQLFADLMTSGYDKICAEIDEEFTRFCLLYDRYLDRYAEMGNLIRDVKTKNK